jgi:rare lipoprotein A
VVGRPEICEAAWYGGGFLGQRTASGEPLDSVHVTAAHRTLPLFTRVRVTNLRNGRSVIATINDRGPVSHHLLIDLSPRAAQELHMVSSGVAPVQIEPVVVSKATAIGTVASAEQRR